MKLQEFDSNHFCHKSHFEDDGTQNYSVFQLVSRFFKTIANTLNVTTWKSKGDCLIRILNHHGRLILDLINYFNNYRKQVKI